MRTPRPVNQKSLYHSAGDIYEKVMNDEIPSENKVKDALYALSVMNKVYGMELKRWELEQEYQQFAKKVELRTIEAKAFDNIPIDETTTTNE